MGIKLLTICTLSVFCAGYVAGDYCYKDVVTACSALGSIGWLHFLYVIIMNLYFILII